MRQTVSSVMAGRMMDQRRQGATRGRSVAWGQMYSAGQHSREKVCVRQRIALRRFGTVLLTSIDTSRPPGYDAMAARRKWHECAVRATPVFRTRPLSSRERPRETRAAPRGARGEAGRKRTRTRPHTERGHTQTAERCAGSAGAVPWRRGSIMRGCWSACLWDRGASGRRTVRSTTGRVTTCSIA